MMNDPTLVSVMLTLILTLLTNSANAHAHLTTDFYRNTCPDVESLVRTAVQNKFHQSAITAPATLRLFFHDCFVRGCDASILLTSPNNQAEKDHPDNLSLAGDGFDTVIKAKAAVDSNPRCRNKVSCADILALAARDVVNLVGGPFYKVELGRRDGRVSTKASVQRRLPEPGFQLEQLRSLFARNGLDTTDLVALSGAHTIGVSHCNRFSKRIYNFSPERRIDPTMNLQFALDLRKKCPLRVDQIAEFDPTRERFDNAYFKNLQGGKGLLTSDQVLFTDARSRNTVNKFAASTGAFKEAFKRAITKLGRVAVLTGNQGELRIDCTKPN